MLGHSSPYSVQCGTSRTAAHVVAPTNLLLLLPHWQRPQDTKWRVQAATSWHPAYLASCSTQYKLIPPTHMTTGLIRVAYCQAAGNLPSNLTSSSTRCFIDNKAYNPNRCSLHYTCTILITVHIVIFIIIFSLHTTLTTSQYQMLIENSYGTKHRLKKHTLLPMARG
jgi:hypothetical protein